MFINKKSIYKGNEYIIFNKNKIKYSKCTKFLGLYIDENLNWEKHINHLKNAVSPLVGVLYRVRNYVPIKFLKQVYFSLIYSKFQYLISIWGSANLTKLKSL